MSKRRAKGEGSIFKEKTTDYWVAEITLPNGRKRRKRSRQQQVVQDWLLDQRKAVVDNVFLVDERITVGDYLDYFMSNVAAHTLAPSTIHSYSYLIRDHIRPEIGRVRLANLRPAHLQSLYSSKLNSGLSKRTVQYIHAILRRSLNEALRSGLIIRNPTDAVTPPRPTKKPPQTLSADEVNVFLKSVEDHHWYPIYLLAITTGMRKGEILGMQWEDVDLEHGTINVKRTLVDIQGSATLGKPKSATAKRSISLSGKAVEALRQRRLEEGFVFTTSTGRPISQRNLTRHFHASLEKAGLKRMRFHDLRHTAATLLLQANIHPKIVQEMLGHSTIVLTLDTYSHVIPGLHDEAASEMDRILE
ncbi:MAG: site-specific integrase [Candidatus Promineifilaceae bacterium]